MRRLPELTFLFAGCFDAEINLFLGDVGNVSVRRGVRRFILASDVERNCLDLGAEKNRQLDSAQKFRQLDSV